MRHERCDLVILGAGFAGSLLAIIARNLGLDVILLERGAHPRFAIGESTTPLANLKLLHLAQTYGLSWLEPFAKYGPWKRNHPTIPCGLKRGFAFFRHQQGEPFCSSGAHENELLVGANPDDEQGETHWCRSAFDAFLVDRAVESGVNYFDRCAIEQIDREHGWNLLASQHNESPEPFEIRASFIVDAAGPGRPLAKVVGLESLDDSLQTATRSVFSHFENVRLWTDVLDECRVARGDHPFSSDHAALHHIIEGGWMWVLRFDNGITSAGFSLDTQRHLIDHSRTPGDEWQRLLSRYPSIQRQFENAVAVRPIERTGRLQRRLSGAAGEDWALLPHSAGFIDPWLSSGIAHTLYGVERLVRVLQTSWSSSDREQRLAEYSRIVVSEIDMIDRITAACFARFDCFPIMVSMSMLYFVAVTYSEHRWRSGLAQPSDQFLLAHDAALVALVRELTDAARRVKPDDARTFAAHVARTLSPYNLAGLCDPQRGNMFPYIEEPTADRNGA